MSAHHARGVPRGCALCLRILVLSVCHVRIMRFTIQTVAISALCVGAGSVGAWERESVESAPGSNALRSDAPDAARSVTPTLCLEAVLRDVLHNNPSLKAARANWQAMTHPVPQPPASQDA